MHRLLVLSIVAAVAVAGPLSGDDKTVEKPVNADRTCVSWDDKITTLLLQPLQDQIRKSQSEFIKVSDENTGFFGVGVLWKNATAGDFSSLQLNTQEGTTQASRLCTNGNTKALTVNLGFGELKAAFDTFLLYTPFFDIGGSKTSLSLKGENLVFEVSTITDSTDKTCTAHLDSLLFTKWGSLELDLGDGLFNMLLSKLFNLFGSTRIIGVLETFNVDTKINSFALQYLTPVMSKYSDMICTALA